MTLSSPSATHFPTSTVVTPKSFATRPHEYPSFLLHTSASVSASIPGRATVPCLRQNSAREIAETRGSRTLRKPLPIKRCSRRWLTCKVCWILRNDQPSVTLALMARPLSRKRTDCSERLSFSAIALTGS